MIWEEPYDCSQPLTNSKETLIKRILQLEKELEEAKAIQVQARVMPNEVVAGDIKLMFGEDTEKYSLWCEIVNDVFMEYDTTSEGEDAQILIDKIERLLKLVSQREA